MKILGFIPARGGSKSIPGKNIKLLNGKPLIAYTIEQALQSKINKVFVSTDSKKIASIAEDYGVAVPFLRPKVLGQDESTIEDALTDTLLRLAEKNDYKPDLIVLLQPTSPFRTKKHIDESLCLMCAKRANTVVSISDPMEHPADMVFWKSDGSFHFLMNDLMKNGKNQRQQYPNCYFLNGAIYAFTWKSFKQTGSRFGKYILPYKMHQIDSIDIDSQDDFKIAEILLKHGYPAINY